MRKRFEVIFLEEVVDFLERLNLKEREKIIYNIEKSQFISDPTLFKKINSTIWEFRTIYNQKCFRILAFWHKSKEENVLVIATHCFLKKTNKTPNKEIEKAEKIQSVYISHHS